jgi:hypothetical protein
MTSCNLLDRNERFRGKRAGTTFRAEDSYTLKMDSTILSNFRTYKTTWRHIQENCNIHFYRHENLILHIEGKSSTGQYVYLQWPMC